MFRDLFRNNQTNAPTKRKRIDLVLSKVGWLRDHAVDLLPILLISASLICVYMYHRQLRIEFANLVMMERTADPADDVETDIPAVAESRRLPTFKSILDYTDLIDINSTGRLIFFYLGIFLAAEAAFILMALKEYLQDILGVSDVGLIRPSERKLLKPTKESME